MQDNVRLQWTDSDDEAREQSLEGVDNGNLWIYCDVLRHDAFRVFSFSPGLLFPWGSYCRAGSVLAEVEAP